MKKSNILTIVYCLILAFAFILLYSTSTSPLFPAYYGDDSAQFRTIGMCWSRGVLPYVGAFDHKGPFIFFVNMLGCLSSFVIIQSLFLFVSLVGAYYIVRLYTDKIIWHLSVVSLVVFYLFYIYEGGNMTEEYCLPFLMWSLYYLLKYLRNKGINGEEHSYWAAGLYGITFGMSILTRVTNILIIIPGIITILIILIVNKKYKNIWQNMIGFVLATLVTVLPFAVYFWINGVFFEFWDGTVLANINYVNVNVPWIFEIDSVLILRNWALAYLCVVVMIIPAFVSKNKWIRLYSIMALILEIAFFCNGKFFYHYAIICVPQLPLAIGEVFFSEGRKKWIGRGLLTAFLIFYSYVNLIAFFRWPYDRYIEYNQEDVMPYDVLMEKVDGTFVAYGDYYTKQLYIRHNILPHYKYFTVQDWHTRISEDLKNDIYNTFKNGDAEYILTQDDKCVLIRDILEDKYICIGSNDGFSLYKIKEI